METETIDAGPQDDLSTPKLDTKKQAEQPEYRLDCHLLDIRGKTTELYCMTYDKVTAHRQDEGIQEGSKTITLEPHQSKVAIIIIPGNPGIAEYYETLARDLMERTHGIFPVFVINYLGFTRVQPEKLYSINEEAEHMAETMHYLNHDLKLDLNYVLVGHSIGAYCSEVIMKASALDISVLAAYHLFPFLALDYHCSFQQRLKPLLGNTSLRQAVSGILGCIPTTAKSLAVKWLCSDLDSASFDISSSYFVNHTYILDSVFHMAHTEFETLEKIHPPTSSSSHVGQDVTEQMFPSAKTCEFYANNADKIEFLYTHDDHWAPITQAKSLTAKLPSVRVDILDKKLDVKHAFVTSPTGNQIVAGKIVEFLDRKKLIPRSRPDSNAVLGSAKRKAGATDRSDLKVNGAMKSSVVDDRSSQPKRTKHVKK